MRNLISSGRSNGSNHANQAKIIQAGLLSAIEKFIKPILDNGTSEHKDDGKDDKTDSFNSLMQQWYDNETMPSDIQTCINDGEIKDEIIKHIKCYCLENGLQDCRDLITSIKRTLASSSSLKVSPSTSPPKLIPTHDALRQSTAGLADISIMSQIKTVDPAKSFAFDGKLPGEETRHVGRFLDPQDLLSLSITSKTTHAALKPVLLERMPQKLLEHVVKGEEKEAQAMLETKPELLLYNNVKTIDYSGKKIERLTPFKAALCAGDTDMVKMMQPYFAKLDDGSQKMAEQIHAVFPKGYDAHLSDQTKATFNFSTVFNAIARATDIDIDIALSLSGASLEQSDAARRKPDHDLTLVEAMNRFRETFSQQSLSETIYNPQHLLTALALYDATFERENRDQWNLDKRDLFWRQIIGFCQRFVPACTAQAFAQGLYYLFKVPEYQPMSWKAEHFNRSLKFRYGEGSIYPIRSHCSGLGFNYAVRRGGGMSSMLMFGSSGRPCFKKFISIKSTSLCAIISGSITPTRDARP